MNSIKKNVDLEYVKIVNSDFQPENNEIKNNQNSSTKKRLAFTEISDIHENKKNKKYVLTLDLMESFADSKRQKIFTNEIEFDQDRKQSKLERARNLYSRMKVEGGKSQNANQDYILQVGGKNK